MTEEEALDLLVRHCRQIMSKEWSDEVSQAFSLEGTPISVLRVEHQVTNSPVLLKDGGGIVKTEEPSVGVPDLACALGQHVLKGAFVDPGNPYYGAGRNAEHRTKGAVMQIAGRVFLNQSEERARRWWREIRDAD